jgi:cell division protein FtsB
VGDASSEIGYSSRDRIWAKLNKCLGVFIAVGIVLPLAYRSLPVVKEKSAQDAKVAELEARLETALMQHRRLSRDVSLLTSTDPEYLSMFARDGLTPGYMKEGEVIFRLERGQTR